MTRAEKYRQLLCEVGQKVSAAGFVAANDGNLSILLNDDTVLITPTNVSKSAMKPGEMAAVTLAGKCTGKNRPSSEYRLHLAIYKNCPDVKAIVHTHAPYATAWAVSGQGLTEAVLPEVVTTIGIIPLVKYETPSTAKFAERVADAARRHAVLLLQNHGLIATGNDLWSAFYKTERAEHAFKIMTIARLLGNVHQLSAAELDDLFRTYEVSAKIRAIFNK